MRYARALTIAGSDSGGGAGIQADLKTFSALGVYGMTAITALTAQNTCEIRAVFPIPAEVVAQQIDAVVEDIGVDAVKIGMLGSPDLIEAVADRVRTHHLFTLVIDPMMVSKTGDTLLGAEALQAFKTMLLPRAHVVTPNLHEAGVLTGMEIHDLEGMRRAARAIQDMGPRYVVVKGGHLEDEPVDLLYTVHDFTELHGERIESKDSHGTGCIFSAAIAGHLAKGATVPEAVASSKAFVTEAIRHGLRIGHGHGPANPDFSIPTLSH